MVSHTAVERGEDSAYEAGVEALMRAWYHRTPRPPSDAQPRPIDASRAPRLQHSVDLQLPISISLAGISGAGALASGGVREQVIACAALGFRAVQLDAAAPGVRARELDRSARRDLAALFRRLGLAFSGLDLWIPPPHFTDVTQSDRAVAAVEAAAGLASDLSALVAAPAAEGLGGRLVCVTLPGSCPGDVVTHLSSACQVQGVTLADHAWPARESVGPVRIGIDPAAIIFAGADPVIEAARLKEPPATARLTDLSPAGRVEPGSGLGRLDRAAYEAALHARGYRACLVADLRGLPDVPGSARRLARLVTRIDGTRAG